MSIVLIGYRGSGKTTIGRRLAERLARGFVDVDDLIVRKAGKSIREIFADHGESHFRELESRAVAEAARLGEHVIAMGGGAMLRPENRRAIAGAGHHVIFLKCDAEELLRRIEGDPATAAMRPNLTALGGGIEEVRKLAAEREPVYRAAMTAEVDVTRLSPEEAVAVVAALVEKNQTG
jgi:shikimate kinase